MSFDIKLMITVFIFLILFTIWAVHHDLQERANIECPAGTSLASSRTGKYICVYEPKRKETTS